MISQQARPRGSARQSNRTTKTTVRPPKPGAQRRGRAGIAPFRFRPIPIAGLTAPAIDVGRQTATPTRRQAQGRANTDRLARSEARLVGVAVAFTITFCVVLVIYLGEYAQATRLSIELSRSSLSLHQATEQGEILKAQYAAARSPQRIISEAVGQKMELSRGRVCYVGTQPTTTDVAGAPSGASSIVENGGDPVGSQPGQQARLASSETHPGPGPGAATIN